MAAAPADAQDVSVVDLDARLNATHRPVELPLDRGVYSVVPIGIDQGGLFDGWSSWAQSTCSQVEGCPRTFPTTNKGFLGDYHVSSAAISRVFVDGLELEAVAEDDGLQSTFVRSEDEDDEANAFFRASDVMVYPIDTIALAHAPVSIFMLDAPATVGFAITDSLGVADNRGGLSLRVTRIVDTSPPAATPRPGALVMPVDFEPRRCPNRLETGRRGKKHVTVAILGTDTFDGRDIEPTSVRLAGVSPERWKVKDVAAPGDFAEHEIEPTDCPRRNERDGRPDLELRFNREVLGDALGNPPEGQVVALAVTGRMKPGAGGKTFSGHDVAIVSR